MEGNSVESPLCPNNLTVDNSKALWVSSWQQNYSSKTQIFHLFFIWRNCYLRKKRAIKQIYRPKTELNTGYHSVFLFWVLEKVQTTHVRFDNFRQNMRFVQTCCHKQVLACIRLCRHRRPIRGRNSRSRDIAWRSRGRGWTSRGPPWRGAFTRRGWRGCQPMRARGGLYYTYNIMLFVGW